MQIFLLCVYIFLRVDSLQVSVLFYYWIKCEYLMLLAYEILGNQLKRRSYDSVDPQFDDSIPSVMPDSPENFYQVFSPAFEQNSRY